MKRKKSLFETKNMLNCRENWVALSRAQPLCQGRKASRLSPRPRHCTTRPRSRALKISLKAKRVFTWWISYRHRCRLILRRKRFQLGKNQQIVNLKWAVERLFINFLKFPFPFRFSKFILLSQQKRMTPGKFNLKAAHTVKRSQM